MKSLIKVPEIIESDRLIYRRISLADYKDLCCLYANPKVMPFIGKGVRTPEETWEILTSYVKDWEENGFGPWAVFHKQTGDFIGRSGVYSSPRSPYVQIGYVLSDRYWGKGLGTEAAKASLNFGFNEIRCNKIVAFVRLENIASRKILGDKLKMNCETEKFSYGPRMFARYGLSRSEYLAHN